MSQKMRRYSMIGLMTVAAVAAVVAVRSSVESQAAIADNEHSHPAQVSGCDERNACWTSGVHGKISAAWKIQNVGTVRSRRQSYRS